MLFYFQTFNTIFDKSQHPQQLTIATLYSSPIILLYTIYDRRGRGQSSDALQYTVECEVEDIEALITEAGGSAYLFGSASGTVLALAKEIIKFYQGSSGLAI